MDNKKKRQNQLKKLRWILAQDFSRFRDIRIIINFQNQYQRED